MKLLKYSLLVAMLVPTMASAVNQTKANFPVGLWNTHHYKLKSNGRKPVQIYVCIQPGKILEDGTTKGGAWYSVLPVGSTIDALRGQWTKEKGSNNLTFIGNGASSMGTGETTLVIPYKMMTGTWQYYLLNQASSPKQQDLYVAYTSKWDLINKTDCTLPAN